jgi:hypothetical protein
MKRVKAPGGFPPNAGLGAAGGVTGEGGLGGASNFCVNSPASAAGAEGSVGAIPVGTDEETGDGAESEDGWNMRVNSPAVLAGTAGCWVGAGSGLAGSWNMRVKSPGSGAGLAAGGGVLAGAGGAAAGCDPGTGMVNIRVNSPGSGRGAG